STWGGSSPCKPSRLRSSSVNAVPLFRVGRLRRLTPRGPSVGVDCLGFWSVVIVIFPSSGLGVRKETRWVSRSAERASGIVHLDSGQRFSGGDELPLADHRCRQ